MTSEGQIEGADSRTRPTRGIFFISCFDSVWRSTRVVSLSLSVRFVRSMVYFGVSGVTGWLLVLHHCGAVQIVDILMAVRARSTRFIARRVADVTILTLT